MINDKIRVMKKEITFQDSWLTKVSYIVKQNEKHFMNTSLKRGGSIMAKYEYLVQKGIIKDLAS